MCNCGMFLKPFQELNVKNLGVRYILINCKHLEAHVEEKTKTVHMK